MFGALRRTRLSIVSVICGVLVVVLAQPALAQLKPGVTQSAAHTANVSGTVAQSNGAPVAGASVTLKGQTVVSTKTDARGSFVFTSIPWGAYQIVVSSTFGTVSRALTLSGDINVAIQYQAQSNLGTIAHVSTQATGAHINITSSSIYSVSPTQYAFSGNSTWQNLFQQIPGVTISGGQNAGLGAYSVYADNPNPGSGMELTINGGLSYETSTELDGMPIAGYGGGSGFDVSLLPMNGFEAADIVRGPGADAPSIVDSIGGSFVLHAPGPVSSDQWELAASNDPYGGTFWNARGAWRFGKLSATFSYGANVSPGPLGSNGYVIYPFTYINPSAINGSTIQAPISTFYTAYGGDPACYCSVTTSLLARIPGDSSWNRHDYSGDLTYEFTRSIVAEVFYAGSSSVTNAYGSQLPEAYVNFAPQTASPPYTGSFAPSPTGAFNYAFMQDTSTGAAPYVLSENLWEEKVTAAIGQGVLRVSALQDNSYNDEYGPYVLPSGNYQLWGTADLGAAPPGTPTAFNGSFANLSMPDYVINSLAWSNNRDYLASYAIQIGSASSIGASYTTSYYNSPDTEDIYFGTIPVYTYSATNAISETTREARVHFTTDVTDALSLGLSWYFADGSYTLPSATGASTYVSRSFPYSAPRFGAVWEASPNIAVRAAAGGGYALPPLSDLVSSGLDCSTSFSPPSCYLTESNPNLKPETSMGIDVGSDARLNQDTVISLDAYHTNLYGAYYFFQSEVPASTCGAPCTGLPLFLDAFSNLTESRMEGINLSAHHDVPKGLYWLGNLGLTRAFVVKLPSGFYNNPSVPCTDCVNQGIIPGVNYNTAVGDLGTIPYSTAYAELGYRWSPGTFFGLAPSYFGPNNSYYTPKAFVEVDAHAGYAINPHMSFLVTLTNVTGVYDQSIQLSEPSYLIPVLTGAPPNIREPNIIPYGPRAITLTMVLNGP